ncbi:hypothetical protein [Pseudomonas sp. Irchel 3E13]|nr:hypothetical protein [Pseudomonas sp. Irchel 3E13]
MSQKLSFCRDFIRVIWLYQRRDIEQRGHILKILEAYEKQSKR